MSEYADEPVPNYQVNWANLAQFVDINYRLYPTTNTIHQRLVERMMEELEAVDEFVRWMPSFNHAEEIIKRIKEKM